MSRSVHSDPYQLLLTRMVAARRAAGLQQTELAERLGRPQSFVSKIERGERRLDVVEFLLVARAIGIDGLTIMADVAAELPDDPRL